MKKNYSVVAKNVNLTFPLTNIKALVNLNIAVERGSIFGLLGPSGSGKTSVLKCIIGFQKITSGIIKVFGYHPGEPESGVPGYGLGYMPQELGLDEFLTIQELLRYFGNLHCLENDELEQRIDYLVKILDLPEKTRMISQLSGGQKRRVSFALTVIHKPRLMLLDEPTVGCDPILRSRIWQSLVYFARHDNITIIITTHYIEEAKSSDKIGLIRKGTILIQESPETLMKTTSLDSLERVFLKICSDTSNGNKELCEDEAKLLQSCQDFSIEDCEPCPIKNITPNLKTKIIYWYLVLTTIISKVLIQAKRTAATLLVQFLIPLLCVSCFGIFLAQIPFNLHVGYVNYDKNGNLTQDFLNCIGNHAVLLINYQNEEEAIYDAQKRVTYGWFVIRPNFSEAFSTRFRKPNEVNFDTIFSSTVVLHQDVTTWPQKTVIEGTIEHAFLCLLQEILQKRSKNPNIGKLFIQMEEPIQGEWKEGDYAGLRNYGMTGMLVCITYVVTCAISVFIMIEEKTSLILERNFAAGVTITQLMTAQVLVRFIIQAIMTTILYFLAISMFDMEAVGSHYLALATFYIISMTGLANGLFIAAACNDVVSASIITNGLLIALFAIDGTLWPNECLPSVVRYISGFLPITESTNSLRGVLSCGWGLDNYYVRVGWAITISWLVFFIIASSYLLKRSVRKNFSAKVQL